MNEDDLKQHLDGLIENTYNLGFAHASYRRQDEVWSDSIDSFREVIKTYNNYQAKKLFSSLLESLKIASDEAAEDKTKKAVVHQFHTAITNFMKDYEEKHR